MVGFLGKCIAGRKEGAMRGGDFSNCRACCKGSCALSLRIVGCVVSGAVRRDRSSILREMCLSGACCPRT